VEPQVVQNGKVANKPADQPEHHVFQGGSHKQAVVTNGTSRHDHHIVDIVRSVGSVLPTNTHLRFPRGECGGPPTGLESNPPSLEPEDQPKGCCVPGWSRISRRCGMEFRQHFHTLTRYAQWLYQLSFTSANGAEGTLSGFLNNRSARQERKWRHCCPAEGCEFSHWSDASTDNPRTDEQVTDSLTITAYFTLKVTMCIKKLRREVPCRGTHSAGVHGNDGTLVEAGCR
jgi:hypothetical protein